MSKEKVISLIVAISSLSLLIYGIIMVPISKVKIIIFKKVFYKDIFFKDVSDNSIYIFLILSVISMIFMFAKQKIASVIISLISYIYMIREIYKLYDIYINLGRLKDNIEIYFGMYLIVIGNTMFLFVSIYNYLKNKSGNGFMKGKG